MLSTFRSLEAVVSSIKSTYFNRYTLEFVRGRVLTGQNQCLWAYSPPRAPVLVEAFFLLFLERIHGLGGKGSPQQIIHFIINLRQRRMGQALCARLRRNKGESPPLPRERSLFRRFSLDRSSRDCRELSGLRSHLHSNCCRLF